MGVIGKFASDGQIDIEADQCAITGREVLGQHSTLQHIKGTPFFYRYLSDFQHKLTAEKVAAIEAQIPTEDNASPLDGKAKHKSNKEVES